MQHGSKYVDSNSAPMYSSRSIISSLSPLFAIMLKCGVNNEHLVWYKFGKTKQYRQQTHTYLQQHPQHTVNEAFDHSAIINAEKEVISPKIAPTHLF